MELLCAPETIDVWKEGEDNFIQECNSEIVRLRKLVGDLMDTKAMGPNER